jgi:hypothetical protein
MSLINNVLKELEDKPSAFTPLAMELPPRAERSAAAPRSTVIVLIVVVAVVIVVAVWNDSLIAIVDSRVTEPGQSAIASTPVPSEPSPIDSGMALTESTARPQPASGNRIIGLQINETGQSMELVFRFEQPARSYLRKRSEGVYVFHVEDIAQAITAPEISHNPWLRSVQLAATDEGVDLQFDTHQGVLVETSQHSDPGQYRWLIRLNKPPADKPFLNPPDRPHLPQPARVIAAQPLPVESSQAASEAASSDASPAAPPVKVKIRPATGRLSDAQQMQKAVALMKSGQAGPAAEILRELQGGKQDRQARIQLIALLQSESRTVERDGEIDSALLRYPGDIDFMLLRAGRLFETGSYQQLVEQFSSVRGSPTMDGFVGAAYQRLEQHDQALGAFSRALAQNPAQPRLWVSLGISQQHERQPDAALQSYRQAIRGGLDNEALLAFVKRRIDLLSRQ